MTPTQAWPFLGRVAPTLGPPPASASTAEGQEVWRVFVGEACRFALEKLIALKHKALQISHPWRSVERGLVVEFTLVTLIF